MTIAYKNGLDRHNFYRNKHHAGNLTLDLSICQIAQKSADKLALLKRSKISANRRYGENVFEHCSTMDIEDLNGNY